MPAALWQYSWECGNVAVGLRKLLPDAKVEFGGSGSYTLPFGTVTLGKRVVFIRRVEVDRHVAHLEGEAQPPVDQAVTSKQVVAQVVALMG